MCIFFISEVQYSDSGNLLMEIRSKILDETFEKARNIFVSPTETSYLQFLDDPEIFALIDPNLEPITTKELLKDVRLFPSKIYLSQINFYCMYRLLAI